MEQSANARHRQPHRDATAPIDRGLDAIASLADDIVFACLLDVLVRKPGNVSVACEWPGHELLRFVESATAIARPLSNAAALGVGAAIEAAVSATFQRGVGNTNLGIVLLLAPLTAAASVEPAAIAAVLSQLTITDAEGVYRAIRQANPGGLGGSAEQDVSDSPTVTLLEAMRLAEDRDQIARQYARDMRDVYLAADLLAACLRRGASVEAALIVTQLTLMAAFGDSLVARKHGSSASQALREEALQTIAAFDLPVLRLLPACFATDTTEPSSIFDDLLRDAAFPVVTGDAPAVSSLHAWLRDESRRWNPGSTADLLVAAAFVAKRRNDLSHDRPLR